MRVYEWQTKSYKKGFQGAIIKTNDGKLWTAIPEKNVAQRDNRYHYYPCTAYRET